MEKYALPFMDRWVKPLIWYSVIMTIAEVSPLIGFGAEGGSRDGSTFFLWSERLIALFFTVEFALRISRSGPGKYIYFDKVFPYLHISPFAWIDLLAILPFWVGFFVPVGWLRFVRMMRICRLLKYYRYSRSLQLNALGFYRAFNQLRGLLFQLFIVGLFFTMIVYEAEHRAQPEAYGNLLQSAWFTVVTITTVGFGDRYPITFIGQMFVGITLLFIIAQACSAIGILNSAFQSVMDEEQDPNVDPMELFQKEREKSKRVNKLQKDYKMEE